MRGIDAGALLVGLLVPVGPGSANAQPAIGGEPIMTGSTNGIGRPGSGCSVTAGVFTCAGGSGATIPATSALLAGSGTAGQGVYSYACSD